MKFEVLEDTYLLEKPTIRVLHKTLFMKLISDTADLDPPKGYTEYDNNESKEEVDYRHMSSFGERYKWGGSYYVTSATKNVTSFGSNHRTVTTIFPWILIQEVKADVSNDADRITYSACFSLI